MTIVTVRDGMTGWNFTSRGGQQNPPTDLSLAHLEVSELVEEGLVLRMARVCEFRSDIHSSTAHLNGSLPVGISGFAQANRMVAHRDRHGGRRRTDEVAVYLNFGAAGSRGDRD